MSKFKQYRRKELAELRPVTEKDINSFKKYKVITIHYTDKETKTVRGALVSISQADRNNGSPLIGDMIARNPKNPGDCWLIAKQYFNDNFEAIPDKKSVTINPMEYETKKAYYDEQALLGAEVYISDGPVVYPLDTYLKLKSK